MRIVDARVIVCSPGRNFVTLKLMTEDGVHGVGDATLNGRELAVASYLSDHVVPLLIGRDARRIEDTWQYLYKGAYWRRGPGDHDRDRRGGHGALGHPGQGREPAGVPAARAERRARRVHGLRPRQRRGHRGHGGRGRPLPADGLQGDPRAVRRSRASRPPTASARATCYYEPAEKGLPPENVWSTERTCAFVPSLFARAAQGVRPRAPPPPRRPPPADAHRGRHAWARRWSPITCSGWRTRCPAELQEGFRLIRQHTTTPIAVGEVFNTHPRLPAAHPGAAHRLHPHHGGARRRHHATCARSRTWPSCTTCAPAATARPTSRPVCMAAALHFDLSVHNFGIQEYMRHTRRDRPRVPARLPLRGRLHASGRRAGPRRRHRRGAGRPTFPYQRAYLPVNRKEDGTVHDW